MGSIDVRPLRTGEADAALEVLGRAFFEDPGAIIVEPDPALREAACRQLFGPVVRSALPFGHVAAAVDGDGRVLAVATWVPPGHEIATNDELVAAGLLDAIAAVPEAAARMNPMVGFLEAQHTRAIVGPHWRLEFFGVDPDLQGTGIGGRLLDAGHETIDARGERCYLETFTTKNVSFYEKRGYRVIVEGAVPGSQTPVWGLIRDPRPDGVAELLLGARRAGRK